MSSISFEEACAYVDQLDLNYLIEVMCGEKYPLPRWQREQAEQCCRQYKNFLLLQKKYIKNTIVPTRDIDEVWHNHILYTKNYFKDCLKIYGHYLHHQPAVSEKDARDLLPLYQQTKTLYLNVFGEEYGLIR